MEQPWNPKILTTLHCCLFKPGLYTPASDIDLVLVGTRVASAQLALKALAVGLTQKRLAKGEVQCIFSARVPIIKFEMAESGLAFDVCCEQPGGPLAAEHVKQLLQQWPALKPLALVLKVRRALFVLLLCLVDEVKGCVWAAHIKLEKG